MCLCLPYTQLGVKLVHGPKHSECICPCHGRTKENILIEDGRGIAFTVLQSSQLVMEAIKNLTSSNALQWGWMPFFDCKKLVEQKKITLEDLPAHTIRVLLHSSLIP